MLPRRTYDADAASGLGIYNYPVLLEQHNFRGFKGVESDECVSVTCGVGARYHKVKDPLTDL